MVSFQAKLDQLRIIKSQSSNHLLLTRALILIHNDVITYRCMAAKEYCSRYLMESLINFCRSSRNYLVIILSTSLLHSICSCGDIYKDIFFKLNGPIFLLSMISPRDNRDNAESMAHTMLIHEQSMKLLALLTIDTKHHQSIIDMGLLEKIAELCEVFSPNGCHLHCCFNKIDFCKEAVSKTKQLVEGKTLIGKIHRTSSNEEDNLSIVAVDLYDTTTQEDVNINKELIRLGFAWPEPLYFSSGTCSKESIDVKETWSDIHVTKVVDAHCFWAFIDHESSSRIAKISKLISDHIYSSEKDHIGNICYGDRVCIPLSKGSKCLWMRGCVLEIEESTQIYTILLVDYGFTVKTSISELYCISNDINKIPQQAQLFVLKGITSAPSNFVILQYICETITNLTQKKHSIRMQLHTMGVTKYLLNYCILCNKCITIKAVSALCNFLSNFNIRSQVGHLGGCKIVIELLHQFSEDQSVLECLLKLLLNLTIECYSNRKIIVSYDGFLLMMKLYRLSSTNSSNKQLIIRVLKNLVKNIWRLVDPINAFDVRGIVESVDSMKISLNPNIYSDDIMEEAKKRRQQRTLRPCEVEPTPRYVSLTIDDLIKKWKPTESSDDSKSEGYKTGTDSDIENNYLKEYHETIKGYEGYIYGTRSLFAEDEFHSLIHATNAHKIKATDIATTICAFLNNGKGGKIYLGITKCCRIVGININRKERDNLRLGIDDLLSQFTPTVKHCSYEIRFFPVMKGKSIKNLSQLEERYITEICIGKNEYQVFQTPSKKIYFRDGNINVESNIQQIREKTILEQEDRYHTEIKVLQMALEETRMTLRMKQN